MKKSIKPHKGRKKPNLLVIISALVLTLAVISPVTASVCSLQFSSPETGYASAQVYSETLGAGGLGVTLISFENFDYLKDIGQYLDIMYMLGGIGAAVLLSLVYTDLLRGENGFIANYRKKIYPVKIGKIAGSGEAIKEKGVQVQKEIEGKKLRLYVAIPILCIAIA